MYRHFIKKAKDLRNTKEKEELEDLMLASIKSLERKIVKYKRALDSYDQREQQYFSALEKNSQEAEKKRLQKEKKKLEKEERAKLMQKYKDAQLALGKMEEAERLAKLKRKDLELKVQQEKQKQIEKLERLMKEKEELKRLQREKEEEVLTKQFLEKERKEREEQERKLTEKFLAEEKQREEQKQRRLTEQFLEKERQENERFTKIREMQFNEPEASGPRMKERKGEYRKRLSKPSTEEQEAERQRLFSTVNEVVNGNKPSQAKDLGWDYEQDKKAQAVFGKMNKRNLGEPKDKCPKCRMPKHKGMCPCGLCGKKDHTEENCPTQSPPLKKRKEKEKQEEKCACCKSKGHKAHECPWNKDEEYMDQEPKVAKVLTPNAAICTHCRALDHKVEECPALELADARRRYIKCSNCGEIGHDITACLDEKGLKEEKKIEQAIKQKQKELDTINAKIHKLTRGSKDIKKPQDKDTNTMPVSSSKPSGEEEPKRTSEGSGDHTPPRERPPPNMGNGGGPPNDPGGSDDGGGDDNDESDDEGDEDEGQDDETEEEEESEKSEESEVSGTLYDIRGRKINIDEVFEEWQDNGENRPPFKVVRGPRGHRGARGKQGKRGPKGQMGPMGNFIDSGMSTGSVNLNTSGLEDSFRQLGTSMNNVWNVQKTLNTSMRDHIQLTAQAQKKNTEALERLNESTRQRDHDHMFMTIEVYDGTDPKKFEPWIEQIEIACRISNRDPRVVCLAKSTGAVTEVIRSMRPGLTWIEFKNELKRCFSESKTRVHAAAIFDSFRKQDDNENLRRCIHKYSKLHREATGKSCDDEYDTQRKLHFLSRLRNSNIAVKISQSAEFEKFDTYSLTKCMEKALLLESRLQIREMVTQAREAIDTKSPEIMKMESKPIEEEVNTIPEDKPAGRSKANCICYKCGAYGHYGKECTVEDKDLEEFANRIVGRIEHSFQAYTPITLQYMNDIIAKAAKLDQSRRIAKTKAKLLQGILNQRGGAQGAPKTPGRGRGRGVPRGPVDPQIQGQGPPVGRGRGGANVVAKKTRQPATSPPPQPPVQPSAPPMPIPIEPQPVGPVKLEPNPFLKVDSHLPEIQEVDEEETEEDLESLTLKELEALQQAVDQELENPEDPLPEKEQ